MNINTLKLVYYFLVRNQEYSTLYSLTRGYQWLQIIVKFIQMDQWLHEGLSKILDFEVPEDLTKYILSIDKEKDLDEYLKTFLDFDNSQHKNFYLELIKKKFPNKAGSQSKQQKKKISKNKNQQDFVSTEIPIEPPVEVESKSKKKTKYVNLYSQEGKNAQVVLLKGRHHCDCQASKHELVNNCLKCGRVVCKQEGSGPCLFCGSLVCTPEEQREINAKTKSSAKLVESLMERNRPKGWEAAMSQRNRLLEYDRTSERRTRVTDDDSDYFSSNSVWLSASERDSMNAYQQKLHDKKHASRLDKKMTFDFAGRQVIEDKTIDYEVDEEQIRQMTRTTTSSSTQFLRPDLLLDSSGDRDVAPGVNAPLLQFDASVDRGQSTAKSCNQLSRIQDASLQEMGDAGRCLSMHQPWASLLVEGIKLHEGRTWYSSHRGRLWIAATARALEPTDARTLQQQYEAMYPDKSMNFPSFYPTGCLLGCVIVDDCLSQEEYAKKYPGGESDSPYVFICSNPISLRLRFPIKGQHKIYSLDKTIHQAAVKSIQKMAKIQAKEANAG